MFDVSEIEPLVLQIESMVEAPRQIVYEFLQRSLKSGGKVTFTT